MWKWEFETGIPRNGGKRKFPLTPVLDTTFSNHSEMIQNIHNRSLAHTVLVPSHDLADPGHRISRHKLDLATRIIILES